MQTNQRKKLKVTQKLYSAPSVKNLKLSKEDFDSLYSITLDNPSVFGIPTTRFYKVPLEMVRRYDPNYSISQDLDQLYFTKSDEDPNNYVLVPTQINSAEGNALTDFIQDDAKYKEYERKGTVELPEIVVANGGKPNTIVDRRKTGTQLVSQLNNPEVRETTGTTNTPYYNLSSVLPYSNSYSSAYAYPLSSSEPFQSTYQWQFNPFSTVFDDLEETKPLVNVNLEEEKEKKRIKNDYDLFGFLSFISNKRDQDELLKEFMRTKDYYAEPKNDMSILENGLNNTASQFNTLQQIRNLGTPIPIKEEPEKNSKSCGGRINKFEVGGEPSIEELALQRATKATAPKANYHQAIDFVYGPVSAMKMAYDKGVSNCTLTASQFYDPKKPIARAKTITTTPHVAGFYEVGENYAIPGSMVIASLPNGNDYGKNSYHTMILNGYADKNYQFPFKGKVYNVKKGDPLVNYSIGKREPENYIKNIPLSAYLDNSDGKTNVRYYRPYNEGLRAKLLPEIIVTPNGNSIAGGGASSTWANGGKINIFGPGGFTYIPDNQQNMVVNPFEFEGIRYGWLPNGDVGEDVYKEHNDRNGVYVRWDNDANKWAKTTVPRDLGNIKNYFAGRHNELATYNDNAPAANAYDPYNNPAISAQLNNLFNNDPVIKEQRRRLFDAKLKEYNAGNFLSTIIPMHLLSPTNYVGAIGEAARGDANFFQNALSGHNRGLFSLSNNLYDWASEHPYLSAGINMLGDAALGAVAAKPFIDWKNPNSLLSQNIRTSFANDKIPFSYVLKDSENILPYFRGIWATLKGERIPLQNRLQKSINRSNHVAYENAPLALPNETYQQYLERTGLPYSSMVESFYNRQGMWNHYQGVGDDTHNLNMSVHGRSENYIKQPDGTYDINLTKEEEANFLTPKDKVNDDFSYVTYDHDIGNHGNVGAQLAYKDGKLVSILTDPFDLHPAEAIIGRLPEGLIRKVGKVIIPNPEASTFLPKGTNIPVFKHTIPIEEQGFIGYNWDTGDIIRPTLRVDAKDLMNNGSFLTVDMQDIVKTFRP